MTSKQRSYLKGLAMTMDAVLQIGKSSLTPEITKSVEEALNARELIKIHVLKNCADDGRMIFLSFSSFAGLYRTIIFPMTCTTSE